MDPERRFLRLFLALLDHKSRYRLARYLQTVQHQTTVRFSVPRDREVDRLLCRVGAGDSRAARPLLSILGRIQTRAAVEQQHSEVARAIHSRDELLDRLAQYIRGLSLQLPGSSLAI